MEITLPRLSEPIAFRFFADFHVQPRETAGFTAQQNLLLRGIVASPRILRRIARMRLETDLEGITGRHLGGLFDGPSVEDILACVLPCLPEGDQTYWEGLKDGPGDMLHQEIVPVLLAFEVTLQRAEIEE